MSEDQYQNLRVYREFLSEIIQQDLEENANFQLPPIQEASKFALSDGKRLRPLIVLSICNTLNRLTNQQLTAIGGALAIEYVHNSSLIIDDLPMMDNDQIRRNKPTVHAKYGQCRAQLVSYNLIVTAMRHLSDNLTQLNQVPFLNRQQISAISQLVYRKFTDKLSIQGLCGGQYLDLHLSEELSQKDQPTTRQMILDLIKRKTSCLFEIAFLLGWLLGGGIVERAAQLEEIGEAFGLMFQMVDDLEDRQQDAEKGNHNNITEYYSSKELQELFMTQLQKFRNGLTELHLFSPVFQELYNYLVRKFRKHLQEN